MESSRSACRPELRFPARSLAGERAGAQELDGALVVLVGKEVVGHRIWGTRCAGVRSADEVTAVRSGRPGLGSSGSTSCAGLGRKPRHLGEPPGSWGWSAQPYRKMKAGSGSVPPPAGRPCGFEAWPPVQARIQRSIGLGVIFTVCRQALDTGIPGRDGTIWPEFCSRG